MKKRVLNLILAASLICGMLTSCGNDAEPTMGDDGVVTIQTEEPSVVETPTPTEAATPEPTEEPTPEPTEEPTPEPVMDWFAEHGLEITPQGDFSYTTMAITSSREDISPFEVLGTVSITETTDGVEDGYKKVTMTAFLDTSGKDAISGAAGHNNWVSAFDRYTGTSFEFDSTVSYITSGESSSKEGFVTIVNGDVSYDVSISFSSAWGTDVVTVTCPVFYNGVVFQIGYWDNERRGVNQTIDYKARLYTIDELPAWGDGYYYFSFSNE